MTAKTKTQNGNGKKTLPTHRLYLVQDRNDGKSQWIEIGAAWAHKDGDGFGIRLNGQLTMRPRKDNNDGDEGR